MHIAYLGPYVSHRSPHAMNTVGLAKAIMKLGEVRPTSPHKEIGTCQELFRHDRFRRAAEAERRAIMLASSQKKYAEELAYPWDSYFGVDLTPYLTGREVLDLGCFNGGRSVAWFERYRFKRLLGIDVAPEFIEAATQFAQSKQVDARFEIARGETLPLASQSVDAIVTFDVFEHVQNLRQTLSECQRVLRPGGRLVLVFPATTSRSSITWPWSRASRDCSTCSAVPRSPARTTRFSASAATMPNGTGAKRPSSKHGRRATPSTARPTAAFAS
jgi:2-polyprenyl-3-methyl-5-hydroxy-6-metoxy-1,4-benzoquinol methylase